MSRGNVKRNIVGKAVAVAMACAISLTGCSNLPFELPELPFELPDLSGIPNPLSSLGTGSSVEEAREAKASEHNKSLGIADLIYDGTLTVGLQTRNVSAPFFIEGTNGIYGIDVDLASALADHLGLAVRFVSVDGVEQPLADGLCDIVMDVDANHSGDAAVVGSYYESSASFFALGDGYIATADDLSGKTVAVQDGSVSQGVLNRSDLSMTQQPYVNLNEAFEALLSGEVDFVLCDSYPGAYLAAAYDGVSFVGSLNDPSLYGVAAPAGKEALVVAVQDALAEISANGEMDIIRSVWIGSMPVITADQVVQGVSISAYADTGSQDGSTAGANAVVVY